MKLTKGKILKLYNKKRQTVKKFKTGKSSYKRRTFRKRKFNLARKTLKTFNYKKYKGGFNNAKEENNTLPSSIEAQNFSNDEINAPTNILEQSVQDNTTQPPVEDFTTQPPVEDDITQQSIDDNNIIKEEQSTELSNKPPFPSQLQPNKKDLLVKSLIEVVDYIADNVAEKVLQNVLQNDTSSQYGEQSQNGFNSVNKVAETMATSGGSKFKKTRRFKLIRNKNKTRHHV